MWKRMLVTVLAASALAWVAVPAAHAIDCEASIKDAEHNLALVEAQSKNVRKSSKARIHSFLDEARRLLSEARADCKRADSEIDQAEAAAKAALAQGDIAAAHIFVKLD